MTVIKERQIMDVVLIANEAIHSKIFQKQSGILCKLVIEKAYVQVNGNFLLSILEMMGFAPELNTWDEILHINSELLSDC